MFPVVRSQIRTAASEGDAQRAPCNDHFAAMVTYRSPFTGVAPGTSLQLEIRESPRHPAGAGLRILEPNEPITVGLVGAGYVSTYHARALRSLPFVEIVGIADLDQDRAEALAEQFKIPKVYPSL